MGVTPRSYYTRGDDVICIVRPDELFDFSETREEQTERHGGHLQARHRLDGKWDFYAYVFYGPPGIGEDPQEMERFVQVALRELSREDDFFSEFDREDLEELRRRGA